MKYNLSIKNIFIVIDIFIKNIFVNFVRLEINCLFNKFFNVLVKVSLGIKSIIVFVIKWFNVFMNLSFKIKIE